MFVTVAVMVTLQMTAALSRSQSLVLGSMLSLSLVLVSMLSLSLTLTLIRSFLNPLQLKSEPNSHPNPKFPKHGVATRTDPLQLKPEPNPKPLSWLLELNHPLPPQA